MLRNINIYRHNASFLLKSTLTLSSSLSLSSLSLSSSSLSSSSSPLSLTLNKRLYSVSMITCGNKSNHSNNANTITNANSNNLSNDIWTMSGNPSNLTSGKLRIALQKLLVEDGGIPYIANSIDNKTNTIIRSDIYTKKKKILKAIANSNDSNNLLILQDLFQLDVITPPLLSSVLQCFEAFNADDLALELYNSLHVSGKLEFTDKHIVSLFKVLKCNASQRINDAINIYNNVIKRESSKSNTILAKYIMELIVAARVDDNDQYYYNFARNALHSCYSSGAREKINDYTNLFLLAGRIHTTERVNVINKLWDELLSKGHTPNVYTYTAKMSSMLSCGKYFETFEIYHDMLQKDVSPSSGQHEIGLLMFLKYANNGKLDWPLCRSILKLMNDVTKIHNNNNDEFYNIIKSIESMESIDIIRKKYENENLHEAAMAYIVNLVRPTLGRFNDDVVPKDLVHHTLAEFLRIGELDKILVYLQKHDSMQTCQDARLWEVTIAKLGNYGEWRAILAIMEQLQSYRFHEWNDNIWFDIQSEAYIGLMKSNQPERSKKLLKEMIKTPNAVISKDRIINKIVNKFQNNYLYISILINDILEIDGKLDDNCKVVLGNCIDTLIKSSVDSSSANISEIDIKRLQQLLDNI